MSKQCVYPPASPRVPGDPLDSEAFTCAPATSWYSIPEHKEALTRDPEVLRDAAPRGPQHSQRQALLHHHAVLELVLQLHDLVQRRHLGRRLRTQRQRVPGRKQLSEPCHCASQPEGCCLCLPLPSEGLLGGVPRSQMAHSHGPPGWPMAHLVDALHDDEAAVQGLLLGLVLRSTSSRMLRRWSMSLWRK